MNCSRILFLAGACALTGMAAQAQHDEMHHHEMNHMSKKNHMNKNMSHDTNHHEMMDSWKPFIVEVSGGAFRPTDNLLRQIYGGQIKNTTNVTTGRVSTETNNNGDWWGSFQFKFSAAVCHDKESLWHRLYAFAAVNYNTSVGTPITQTTSSTTTASFYETAQKTTINNVPVSFGLRFIQPMQMLHNNISMFAGLGIQASINAIKNASTVAGGTTNVIANPKGTNYVGGIFETGLYGHIHENVLASFTVDYSFAELPKLKSTTESVDKNLVLYSRKVSGLALRVGLGGTF